MASSKKTPFDTVYLMQKSFGELLDCALKRMNMPRKEAAERLKMTPSGLSRLINSKNKYTEPETVRKAVRLINQYEPSLATEIILSYLHEILYVVDPSPGSITISFNEQNGDAELDQTVRDLKRKAAACTNLKKLLLAANSISDPIK